MEDKCDQEEEYIEIQVDESCFEESDTEDGEIQEVYHKDKIPRVTGVICWNLNGYTVTNGVDYISRDETDGSMLDEDIKNLKIDRLYVVECVRKINFRRIIMMDPLHPVDFPKCFYCNSIMCHRWKATRGGLQRLVSFKVDVPSHEKK